MILCPFYREEMEAWEVWLICPQITHTAVAESSFEFRGAWPEILLVTLFLQQPGAGHQYLPDQSPPSACELAGH